MARIPKNRTNVRFCPALVGLVLSACSSSGTLVADLPRCRDASIEVCETFAGERRCACVPRRAVRNELPRLGTPAAFGP